MKPVLKTGILIAALCLAWMLLMGVAGWSTHPTLMNLFWLVVVLQAGSLVWGLRLTAAENSYGRQVIAGTQMSLVAAMIIFCGSILMTSVIFPHYFAELRTLTEQMLRAKGTNEADIAQLLAMAERTQTSFWQALFGALGTIFTGVIASSVIGAFVRRKPGA
jgi:hypothetical protein